MSALMAQIASLATGCRGHAPMPVMKPSSAVVPEKCEAEMTAAAFRIWRRSMESWNLCRVMDSDHETILFYSKVPWLSKGNVVNRAFELRGELKLFLKVHGKDDLFNHFNEVLWEPRLAYLADIFEQLNRLNYKLQGKERNVFHLMDCLRAFLVKFQNWQRKVNAGNVAMFENLSTVLDETEKGHLFDPSLKTEITQLLKSLESELKRIVKESFLWHS
ncbi:protein FAM200A-like [Homarus americanus]|uniref:protein FAM200A-like n=1 Tax=Homarus americanus TaxID=6706 RepID=UPI001C47F361|nr:protein FAM200A-like [Homarus americanus]